VFGQRRPGALDILSKPFPGHESLTPKERVALAQIIRGASSKEAGRTLGVSPRTVDFHRAKLFLKKRGACHPANETEKAGQTPGLFPKKMKRPRSAKTNSSRA
jgi:DNA-binding CsgD family transcriptional regulator